MYDADSESAIAEEQEKTILPGQEGSSLGPDSREAEYRQHEVVRQSLEEGDIGTSVIDEVTSVEPINYTIDVSDLQQIASYQIEAIESLTGDGDNPEDSIAIYLKVNNDLALMGYGSRSRVSRVVIDTVEGVFDGEARLYRDFQLGEKPIVVERVQIAHMRMCL